MKRSHNHPTATKNAGDPHQGRPPHDRLKSLQLRADLRMLIYVMEHTRGLHPLGWQLTSLKRALEKIGKESHAHVM